MPVAVTNGRMLVTTSSSVDTPEVSSNDEDDVSNYSSHSSVYSAHPYDDPSAIVDDTGHLRPVTEDDVLLELESDGEDDEIDDYNDYDVITNDAEEHVDHSHRSPATIPKQMIKQRQNAARPPTRAKPARPSRKIQPTEIPKITVVDFGEDEVGDGERGETAESSGTHVDPLIIVENENTATKQNRPRKFGARKNQTTHPTPPAGATNDEASESDQIHTQSGPGERTLDSSRNAGDPVKRLVSKSGAKTEADGVSSKTQSTQGKSSKSKFSSILARFQRLDGEG